MNLMNRPMNRSFFNTASCVRIILSCCLMATLTTLPIASVKAEQSPALDLTPYINVEVSTNYWDIDFVEDDFALGFSAALGLRIHPLVSIELGYHNLGTMNFISRENDAEGELIIDSVSGSLLLHIPFNKNYKGFVQIGAEEIDYTEQSTADTFDFENTTESFFGIGIMLKQSKHSSYKLSLASQADGDIIRLSIGGNLDLTNF